MYIYIFHGYALPSSTSGIRCTVQGPPHQSPRRGSQKPITPQRSGFQKSSPSSRTVEKNQTPLSNLVWKGASTRTSFCRAR